MMGSSDEEEDEAQSDDNKDEQKQVSEAAGQAEGKKKKKKRNKKKKQEADTTGQEQVTKASQSEQKKPQKASAGGLKKADADDVAYLDKIIKQNQEEQKSLSSVYHFTGDSSVLRMDRKNFNYKKELKQLFTKSAQAYGALGLDEEEKEERKNRGAGEMAEQYEGASKKMKRRIKMIERMQDKLKVGSGRKYLMV